LVIAVVLFVAGLGLLVAGAEFVVRSASRVATMLGVTPMVIGLTIVSVGTSTPELAIGIFAGLQGKGGLAVGNIAGTNVLNMLFILGLSALLRPLPLHLQIFKLELPAIVFAAGLMTVLAWDEVLSYFDGMAMLFAAAFYTVALILLTRRASPRGKKEYAEEYGPETVPPIRPKWRLEARYALLLIAGIALTVLGAEFLVRGASDIARTLGVSDTVIGLTIVAIGTSAPELVTTIISTIKDDRDVAVGNLLGSSIYNILIILSVPCIIAPGGIPVEPQLLWFDIPLMAGVAIGAIPVFITGKCISRGEGGLGVAIYLAYLTWLIFFRPL
jgi:cation:H+ antiporter